MSEGEENRKGFRRGRPPRSAPRPEAESTGGADRDRPDRRQPQPSSRRGTEFLPRGGRGAGADNRYRSEREPAARATVPAARGTVAATRGTVAATRGIVSATRATTPAAIGTTAESGHSRQSGLPRSRSTRDDRDRPPRDGEGRPPQDRRPRRHEEPDLPEEISASDLDGAVRRDLLSLDKSNADAVARHLVMTANLLEDDPRLALAHARAARDRAGRIAVVRETGGVAAYHAGEWAEALSELRAARRMSGGPGLVAVMADCERGLGRPERAIELGRSEEARALDGDAATELRIVLAGARLDLGEVDQALATLQTSELDSSRTGLAAARLFYAYADALLVAGRTDDALTWFLNAAAADLDGDTDAEDRVAELSDPGAAE